MPSSANLQYSMVVMMGDGGHCRLMESEQSQASLKAEMHAKVLVVSERLEGLIARETRHASRRGELSVRRCA